jgi:hypothetical protein
VAARSEGNTDSAAVEPIARKMSRRLKEAAESKFIDPVCQTHAENASGDFEPRGLP